MDRQGPERNSLISVLCIGPMHGLTTGQKEAFIIACQAFEVYETKQVSIGGEGLSFFKKIAIPLYAFASSFVWIIRVRCFSFKQIPIAYITMSRSFFGLSREAPILVLLKFARIPIVNHVHGAEISQFYREATCLVRRFIRWCYEAPACHVVLLSRMVEQLADFKKSDIQVVKNCVSPPNYREEDVLERFFYGRGIKVFFLSNLIVEKGVEVAIDAVNLARARGAKVDFVIAGGGGDERIKGGLRKEEAAGGLRYVGVLDRRRKWWALEEADVLVFPSYYKAEAFPLVLIEAMMAGCAIICTDHNYLRDVVIEDGAILVSTQNPKAIADAIDRLYRERQLLLDMQVANRRASVEYGFCEFKKKLNNVVESVAKER